jgi:hypothetical protein
MTSACNSGVQPCRRYTIKNDVVGQFTFPKPTRTVVFTNDSGKRAVIDFSGDSVTFSGDLPIDEAAQIFFKAVGHLLKGSDK